MVWQQNYLALGTLGASALVAAVPVVVMLASLAFFHIKAHWAALLALASALLIAVFAFGMPAIMAGEAALFGAANGLLPIGWIVLNIIFRYRLATHNGAFQILQDSVAVKRSGPPPAWGGANLARPKRQPACPHGMTAPPCAARGCRGSSSPCSSSSGACRSSRMRWTRIVQNQQGQQVLDDKGKPKRADSPVFVPNFKFDAIHNQIEKAPPVVAKPVKEPAVYRLNWLTATGWFGHEGEILRYVFFHSLALAALVGLLVMGQAYVWPLTALVAH